MSMSMSQGQEEVAAAAAANYAGANGATAPVAGPSAQPAPGQQQQQQPLGVHPRYEGYHHHHQVNMPPPPAPSGYPSNFGNYPPTNDGAYHGYGHHAPTAPGHYEKGASVQQYDAAAAGAYPNGSMPTAPQAQGSGQYPGYYGHLPPAQDPSQHYQQPPDPSMSHYYQQQQQQQHYYPSQSQPPPNSYYYHQQTAHAYPSNPQYPAAPVYHHHHHHQQQQPQQQQQPPPPPPPSHHPNYSMQPMESSPPLSSPHMSMPPPPPQPHHPAEHKQLSTISAVQTTTSPAAKNSLLKKHLQAKAGDDQCSSMTRTSSVEKSKSKTNTKKVNSVKKKSEETEVDTTKNNKKVKTGEEKENSVEVVDKNLSNITDHNNSGNNVIAAEQSKGVSDRQQERTSNLSIDPTPTPSTTKQHKSSPTQDKPSEHLQASLDSQSTQQPSKTIGNDSLDSDSIAEDSSTAVMQSSDSTVITPVKRGRGRPRKYPIQTPPPPPPQPSLSSSQSSQSISPAKSTPSKSSKPVDAAAQPKSIDVTMTVVQQQLQPTTKTTVHNPMKANADGAGGGEEMHKQVHWDQSVVDNSIEAKVEPEKTAKSKKKKHKKKKKSHGSLFTAEDLQDYMPPSAKNAVPAVDVSDATEKKKKKNKPGPKPGSKRGVGRPVASSSSSSKPAASGSFVYPHKLPYPRENVGPVVRVESRPLKHKINLDECRIYNDKDREYLEDLFKHNYQYNVYNKNVPNEKPYFPGQIEVKHRESVDEDNVKDWVCALCQRGPLVDRLGELYGPYFVNVPQSLGSAEGIAATSEAGFEVEKEVWFHDHCILWSPCYSVGIKLYELESTIRETQTIRCLKCNQIGATIACFQHGCPRRFLHYPCAKEVGYVFEESRYRAFCLEHNPCPERLRPSPMDPPVKKVNNWLASQQSASTPKGKQAPAKPKSKSPKSPAKKPATPPKKAKTATKPKKKPTPNKKLKLDAQPKTKTTPPVFKTNSAQKTYSDLKTLKPKPVPQPTLFSLMPTRSLSGSITTSATPSTFPFPFASSAAPQPANQAFVNNHHHSAHPKTNTHQQQQFLGARQPQTPMGAFPMMVMPADFELRPVPVVHDTNSSLSLANSAQYRQQQQHPISSSKVPPMLMNPPKSKQSGKKKTTADAMKQPQILQVPNSDLAQTLFIDPRANQAAAMVLSAPKPAPFESTFPGRPNILSKNRKLLPKPAPMQDKKPTPPAP